MSDTYEPSVLNKRRKLAEINQCSHILRLVITHELIKTLHRLSLPQAAWVVGISCVCRRLGINRWEFKRGKGKCWMEAMPEESTDIRPSVWADGDFIQYTEDGKMNKRSIDYDLGSLIKV